MPRLEDLVVTEVSLVTRAANKRKFLCFKSEGKEMPIDIASVMEAVKTLGSKVDTVLEKTGQRVEVSANADQGDLVKALGEFGDKVATAFEKTQDEARSAADELTTLKGANEALTAEVTDLKKQLEEAASDVPEEAMEALKSLSAAIPSEEDMGERVKAAVEKATGKAS